MILTFHVPALPRVPGLCEIGSLLSRKILKNKVRCVFFMVAVYILPHVEFGRNDHREDVPHFIFQNFSGQ